MNSGATVGIIGLILGGGFLLAAVASTISRVTLSVFNPWLLREVRRSDQPRAFHTLVMLYWLFGLAGVGVGMAALFGGFRG